MDPFTTTTLLLLFTEELLATDDEDFAELEDATELLDPSTSLGMTLEEGGSSTLEDDSTELEETAELELLAIEEELFTLEELTTDEDDSTELEEVTELELAIELLDPSLSLRMTLEEELGVTLEENSSAGFSSPDEPFAEVLSSQATRPKASAKATLVKKFFFIFHFLEKISGTLREQPLFLCRFVRADLREPQATHLYESWRREREPSQVLVMQNSSSGS